MNRITVALKQGKFDAIFDVELVNYKFFQHFVVIRTKEDGGECEYILPSWNIESISVWPDGNEETEEKLSLAHNRDSFDKEYLESYFNREPAATPEKKLEAANKILPILARINDSSLRDFLLTKASKWLSVDKYALYAQTSRIKLSNENH